MSLVHVGVVEPFGTFRGWRPSLVEARLLEGVLSIGRTPEETDSRRSGRRVFMLAFIIATLLGIPVVIARFGKGYTWVGVVDLVSLVISVVLIVPDEAFRGLAEHQDFERAGQDRGAAGQASH